MHTNVKNSFLTVAKGFYYGAYCDPETINSHVEKWQGWLSSWQNKGNNFGREELHLNPQYHRLLVVTNRVWPGLRNYQSNKAHDSGNDNLSPTSITIPQIESDMQELVQLVLQNSSDGMHSNVTNSFLTVAKGFYYGAYCNPETINSH
ncbi:hypothetical protein JHK82_053742 [Glycine max]|nr:hypothetical protein JHK86_053590 [Glycine max]KAG5086345.1 hypothetical protein JHK82_053742 [Glycine max]